MTGKVDLGEDVDVALSSVGHDLAQVVEREVHAATILGVVEELLTITVVGERAGTHGAHLGQFGIFGNLDTPALVIGEVPVEAVEFIECQDVEHLLHLVLVEEVTGHVHHEATMLKLGMVLDAHEGEAPLSATSGAAELVREELAGEQLHQGLQGIELTTET